MSCIVHSGYQPTYTASTSRSPRLARVHRFDSRIAQRLAHAELPSTSARRTPARTMRSAATLDGVSMHSSRTGRPTLRSFAACSAGG